MIQDQLVIWAAADVHHRLAQPEVAATVHDQGSTGRRRLGLRLVYWCQPNGVSKNPRVYGLHVDPSERHLLVWKDPNRWRAKKRQAGSPGHGGKLLPKPADYFGVFLEHFLPLP